MAKQCKSEPRPTTRNLNFPAPATTLDGLCDQMWDSHDIYRAIHGYVDGVSNTMRGMAVCPTTKGQDGLLEHICMRLVWKGVPFKYCEGEHSFEVPTSAVKYIQQFIDLHAIQWGQENGTQVYIYNDKTDKMRKAV